MAIIDSERRYYEGIDGQDDDDQTEYFWGVYNNDELVEDFKSIFDRGEKAKSDCFDAAWAYCDRISADGHTFIEHTDLGEQGDIWLYDHNGEPVTIESRECE